MQPLEYETPRNKKLTPLLFWLAFSAAYLPGITALSIVNEMFWRRSASYPDGRIIVLSIFAFPLFAGAAATAKAVWKKYETVGFAVAFAIVAPFLTYLIFLTRAVLSE